MTRTTLSAAAAAKDNFVTLTSISGLQVGMPILVDSEEMRVASVPTSATLPVGVTRGVNGTAVSAHAVSAAAIFGSPSEFLHNSLAKFQTRRRDQASYSAAGAIALPTPGNDSLAVITGTSALAMTLADPAIENDGDMLYIVGDGKAAHTVTYTAGLGNGGSAYDVMTFNAGGQNGIQLVAINGKWVLLSPMTGTLTAAVPAVA